MMVSSTELSDTSSSGAGADHRGYISNHSNEKQINWWVSDEDSVQTGQRAIFKNDDISTGEHMEEHEESTNSHEDSTQDSKYVEWTPGNNLDNMLDEARRMNPGERLSDEVKEDISHMLEGNIGNEI